jgi:hypothetical protein
MLQRKLKITVYGNCQAPVIARFLELMCPDVEIVPTERVHLIPRGRPENVLGPASMSDIVIHQPIRPEVGPISSDALRSEFPGKTFISFPSIYFAGLLPQLVLFRLPSPTLHAQYNMKVGPLANWHDARIIEAFLNGVAANDVMEYVSERPLSGIFSRAFERSLRKEEGLDIRVMSIVSELHKVEPCFFMPNHPSNLLLWRTAAEILSLIGRKAESLQSPPTDEALGILRGAVPDVIAKELEVEWRRSEYQRMDRILPMRGLIQQYLKIYQDEPDFEDICQHNKGRLQMTMLGRAATVFA